MPALFQLAAMAGSPTGLATLAVVIVALAFFLLPHAAADLYDVLIVHMTAKWYAAVLERLEPGSRVLDVGIGTAGALVRAPNPRTVRDRHLSVVGLDYEACYVAKAKLAIAAAGLSDAVSVHCESVYDVPRLRAKIVGARRFDAVYFSGSLTLMPDPAAALKCVAGVLEPHGLVYVTQTYQLRRVPVWHTAVAALKPLLRHLTSVDFGRLTYLSEVHAIVERAGMELVEDVPVPGSIDNFTQSARLLVLRPRKRS